MAINANTYAQRASSYFLDGDRSFAEPVTHRPQAGPSRPINAHITEVGRADRRDTGEEIETREILVFCNRDQTTGIDTARVGNTLVRDSEPAIVWNFSEIVESNPTQWALRYIYVLPVARGGQR